MSIVGIDVGTTSAKGIALDEGGRIVAEAECGYPLHTPHAGWSEQDPEDWWKASRQVLEELTAAAGAPRGIGLSGQMHGLVALDAEDRPVRPAILWNDTRTAAECEAIESRVGGERLVELTGNRALPGFTAPKLLWLRRHEPEAYAAIRSIMLPKDYVRLRLTGERAGDVSDASGTLLFDVGKRSWSTEMCEELEIPVEWLPPALESGADSGHTEDGVIVAAGAGDQAAGALGVGILRPGAASVVLGTSGVVFAPTDAYRPDPQGRTHTFCHAAPDTWHAMGVMLSAAGSLRWLRDVAAPGVEFGALVEEAARWAPGAEGLVFLPYLSGERTPHDDPDARGAFSGLSLRHDRGALVRAVLEGVALGLRDCLDVVADTAGHPASGHVSGGGARSREWLRILASALELPLTRMAVDDAAALGAAMLGGVAGGVWPDLVEAASAAVRAGETVEPEPERVEAYAELRERFRALYPALRGSANPNRQVPEESTS